MSPSVHAQVLQRTPAWPGLEYRPGKDASPSRDRWEPQRGSGGPHPEVCWLNPYPLWGPRLRSPPHTNRETESGGIGMPRSQPTWVSGPGVS